MKEGRAAFVMAVSPLLSWWWMVDGDGMCLFRFDDRSLLGRMGYLPTVAVLFVMKPCMYAGVVRILLGIPTENARTAVL